MTLNNFLAAIAKKLREIWPDRNVYVNEIPNSADGQFYVGIIESEQSAHLNKRRKRSIQFEILYFLSEQDNTAFYDWVETMYDSFETLDVQETDEKTRTVHLTNQSARADSNTRVYQFTFDADFYYVQAETAGDPMETLTQTEGLK